MAVKTNLYSVPVKGGTRVEARIQPLHVEIWHAGRRIARHERATADATRCSTSRSSGRSQHHTTQSSFRLHDRVSLTGIPNVEHRRNLWPDNAARD